MYKRAQPFEIAFIQLHQRKKTNILFIYFRFPTNRGKNRRRHSEPTRKRILMKKKPLKVVVDLEIPIHNLLYLLRHHHLSFLKLIFFLYILFLILERFSELGFRKPSSASELKRKQTTAVVLLGVIGTEFGQDVGDRKKDDQRRKSSVVEGFGIGNNNLARLTSNIFFP